MEYYPNDAALSYGIIHLSNGEYLTFGNYNAQTGNGQGAAMKLDNLGNPIDTFSINYPQVSLLFKNAFEMKHGFLLTGLLLYDTIVNGFQPYFVRLDENLDTLWTRKLDFGWDSIAYVSYTIMCKDSSMATTGIFIDTSGDERILLLKTDTLGNVHFVKSYGYANEVQNNYQNMDQTLDGGFIIAGSSSYFHPLGNGYYKHLAIKTDSLGNLQWNFPWGRNDNNNGGCRVKAMSDSTIIVYTCTPTSASPTPVTRWNFRKLRYNMSTVWYVEHGPDEQGNGIGDMVEMNDSGFVMNRSYWNRLRLTRYDKNGNMLWSRLNKPSVSQFFGISLQLVKSDSGFVYSGYIIPQWSLGDTLTQDIFAIKTNCIGWADPPFADATTGSMDNFEVVLENNSMYFGNVYIDWGDGNADTLYENSDTLIYHTYATDGNFSATVIAEACGDTDTLQLNVVSSLVGISEHEKIQSFKIYPNPANDFLNIQTKRTTESIKVIVYDLSGKQLMSLSANNTDYVLLDISSLASGLYLVEVVSGVNIEVQKLTIER